MGARALIWLPMWQVSPTGSSQGSEPASAYRRSASEKETPNLSSAPPVEILACPPAATSGLTRKAILEGRPICCATREMRRISGSDSTLISEMPASRAKAISLACLPTPEKTILLAGTPAARARRISPSETVSAPAPSRARVARTARFGLALTA